MLTPNGRFEVNKEICLSFTDYHPEEWQPAWGIRTALMALIGFLPSQGKGAIGALDYTDEERRALARQSRDWVCEVCGMKNSALLKDDEAVRGQARERASSDSGADLLPRIQFNYEGGDRGQPVPDRASGSLDANASSNIVIQEGHSYVRANRGNPDQHGGGLPIITDAPEVHRAIATDRPRPLEERTQQGEDGGSHPHPNATTKRLDAIICALIAIIAFLILRRVP
ncbi:hypothetical protein EV182_000553 [Spiromyces aspiralis]|uniref:Uncharacterized protein n=1 Tax=Spiromyces aspiralis TaxID=68401 RepID=A0ACC1HN81_9FUNG|nr:hypothetical protein EV182_000553 [Spiromyces aspiralis]